MNAIEALGRIGDRSANDAVRFVTIEEAYDLWAQWL